MRMQLIAAAMLVTTPALADGAIKIGELTCAVTGGLAMVLASSSSMNCTYTSTNGATEGYTGTIKRFGLEIGKVDSGVLGWAVFAPRVGIGPHALAGDYVGAGAGAAVGVGLGANALVGGLQGAIGLQPVSIQTMNGVALSAGVASLSLR